MLFKRIIRTVCISILGLVGGVALPLSVVTAQSASPELPRVYVETTMPPVTGNTYTVAQGGDLQAALNMAAAADATKTHLISVAAGATFAGPFTLPARGAGTGWVIVQSSAVADLPPAGVRVQPSDAANMPKIVSSGLPSGPPSYYPIRGAPGAHHYRLVGLEVTPTPGNFIAALVSFGSGTETSLDQFQHDYVVDRCYVHGDPTVGGNKGVAVYAKAVAVVDSYVSDIKSANYTDTNAVWTWGPGPLKVVNNYLEASGENIFFGGAQPTVTGIIPSDVEIRRNYIRKPPSWNPNDPSYGGVTYVIKNLFEMKTGNRVLIDGNVLDGSWAGAQLGFAFVMTAKGDSGLWANVSDITFTNNIIRNAGSGAALGGTDPTQPMPNPSQRILVGNNLWENIGGAPVGGNGYLFEIENDPQDLIIEHNTRVENGTVNVSDGKSVPNQRMVFRNNLTPVGGYVWFATGVGAGNYALDALFPGAVFTGNVMPGPWPTGGVYPSHFSHYPGNFFPTDPDAVGFVNRAGGDYRLNASSPYKNAGTDGKDPGVDFAALYVAQGKSPNPPTQLRVLPPK